MKFLFNMFLIINILLSSTLNARYVCTKDQAFIDWLNQDAVDVNDDTVLAKYSDRLSCESQCRTINSCISVDSNVPKEIAPFATYYTKSQRDALLASVGNRDISTFKINTLNGSVTINNIEGLNGSAFVFPTGNPSSGVLTSTIYSQDGLTIKTHKFYKYDYFEEFIISTSDLNTTDRAEINNKVNNLITNGFEVVGFIIDAFKLMFSTPLSNNDFQWNTSNGTKVLFSEGTYNIKLVTNTSLPSHKYYF